MKDLLILGIGGAVLLWGLNEYSKTQKQQIIEPDNLNNVGQTPEEAAFANSFNDLGELF